MDSVEVEEVRALARGELRIHASVQSSFGGEVRTHGGEISVSTPLDGSKATLSFDPDEFIGVDTQESPGLEDRAPSEREAIVAQIQRGHLHELTSDASLLEAYLVVRGTDRCDPPAQGHKLSADVLRVLRNVPFARSGYNFSSPDLSALFADEPWYVAVPGVDAASPPDILPADRDCVARIRAIEAVPRKTP